MILQSQNSVLKNILLSAGWFQYFNSVVIVPFEPALNISGLFLEWICRKRPVL
jgi:hypothetical protein